MATFDKTAELSHPVDYRLVANGFVSMFWAQHVLDKTLEWLSVRGYQLVILQAGEWRQTRELHQDFAEALDFPDYYGMNLDALNDCLRDVALGDYGLDQSATGFVLVLRRFDSSASAEPRVAQAVLDIFADRARNAALFGQRMLCLVQSDDPDLRFTPVGATEVNWNDAEWRDDTRGQRSEQ
jgi:RNAse (barnase) inhibitor barstar